MGSCSYGLIRFLMFIFNFIFWLSGLVLIVVGAVIYAKYGQWFSYADNRFAEAEYFIIGVGVVVSFIGFLGCCGVLKNSYGMVTTFAILLSIIFILEIAAAIVGYVYKGKVNAAATTALDTAVKNYDSQEGAKKLMDWAQTTFTCCGLDGPSDYDRGANKSSCGHAGQAVASCHKNGKCVEDLYRSGCKEKIIEFAKSNMSIIAGVVLGIGLIEIFGIVFSCNLMKGLRSGSYENV